MTKRKSTKKNLKKKPKKYTKKFSSNKSIKLIYYKMKKCKYCKLFEKELWKKIKNYCNKNNIKISIIIRENNLNKIPIMIKKYPSLVKQDKKGKMIIFKKERTLNNIKKFIY